MSTVAHGMFNKLLACRWIVFSRFIKSNASPTLWLRSQVSRNGNEHFKNLYPIVRHSCLGAITWDAFRQHERYLSGKGDFFSCLDEAQFDTSHEAQTVGGRREKLLKVLLRKINSLKYSSFSPDHAIKLKFAGTSLNAKRATKAISKHFNLEPNSGKSRSKHKLLEVRPHRSFGAVTGGFDFRRLMKQRRISRRSYRKFYIEIVVRG